jgi:hypothetical protein
MENERYFSTEKNASFYSEFGATSEYIILFRKYCSKKNDVTDTTPF